MATAISSNTNPVLEDETCFLNDELSELKLRGGPNETAIQFEPF
jgi:hypothetical protein